MTKIEQCKYETQMHIDTVKEFIHIITDKLEERAENHDKSKLCSPELEIFAEYTPRLKNLTYGSEEYQSCLKEMDVALKHHYAVSRHHPEHHHQGIEDFNLVDLVEFCCDIKAASMRQNNGNVLKSLDVLKVRFEIPDKLISILKNTMIMFEV